MTKKLSRIVALMLAVIMTFTMLLVPAEAASFKDVPSKAWYKAAVDYVTEREWMAGISSNTFGPNVKVTRAMAVTVLAKLAGAELDGYAPAFEDTKEGAWYTKAAAWAADNGITSGVSETEFAPNRAVTREQLVAFIYKLQKAQNFDLTVSEANATEFADADAIADYAQKAVKYCAANGIVSGNPDGSFGPKQTATRAQLAVMVMKLDQVRKGEAQPMPAQSFDESSDEVRVLVEAPEGALPEESSMTVRDVPLSELLEIKGEIPTRGLSIHMVSVDITFKKDGAEIEPERPVEVTLKNLNLERDKIYTVNHYLKDGSKETVCEIRSNDLEDLTSLSFTAGSFSVYEIVDSDDTSDAHTYSRKYIFHDASGDEFNTQYVGNGEKLYNPGTPAAPEGQDLQFIGWYTKNGDAFDTLVIPADDSYAEISGITANETVDLYPNFSQVFYIVYYDENYLVYRTETNVHGAFTVSNDRKTSLDASAGKYRIEYQPDSSEEAFFGWSVTMAVDGDGNPQTQQVVHEVTFPEGENTIKLYPFDKKAIWLSFDKNDWVFAEAPAGTNGEYNLNPETGEYVHVDDGEVGTYVRTGTGAAYVAPIYIYEGEATSISGSQNPHYDGLPTTTRPGYTFAGWYTDKTLTTEFTASSNLTQDTTVYAKWNPAQSDYRIVYWVERATDPVDATDAQKTYDYVGSTAALKDKKTGETVTLADTYKTFPVDIAENMGLELSGLEYNATNSDTDAVTVTADGKTTLNVKFDRKVFEIKAYVSSTSNTITYRYGNSTYSDSYLGDPVHVLDDYNTLEDNSKNIGTYQVSYYTSGYCIKVNGIWWEIGRYGSYVYNANSIISVSPTDAFTIKARYGASIRSYFDAETTTHNGYQWGDGDFSSYKYPFQSLDIMPAANENIGGYYRGDNKTIYYYVEAFTSDTENIREFNSKRYKLYKTVNHDFNYLTYNEEYHDIVGYERNHSWAEPEFSTSNDRASIGSNNTNYLYYNRRSYAFKFIDSFEGEHMMESVDTKYEQDVIGYGNRMVETKDDAGKYILALTVPGEGGETFQHEGYRFTGWYADSACTTKIFFKSKEDMTEADWKSITSYKDKLDDEGNPVIGDDGEVEQEAVIAPYVNLTNMPAREYNIYAGWTKLRYRVWVQPNGGILTNTESTFFRADYDELINEYLDVDTNGRNYIEDPAGEYVYINIALPDGLDANGNAVAGENVDAARVAYYKKYSELNESFSITTSVGTAIYNEKLFASTQRYSPRPNAYKFVGWYKVNKDISETVNPEIHVNDNLTVWNFGNPIREHTAIRALWKSAGKFSVVYDGNMYTFNDDGTKTIAVEKAEDAVVPDTTEYEFADLSTTVTGYAPTVIPEGYYFLGWRTPDGEVHQTFDTYTVYSLLAESAGEEDDTLFTYTLTAVYGQMPTSTLTYDPNGGSGQLTDLSDLYKVESFPALNINGNVVNGIVSNSPITFSSGNGFNRNGYEIVAWADKVDATTHEPTSDAHIFQLNGDYAIGSDTTLYAVWQIGSFYIFHSSTGVLEAAQVTLENDVIQPYNLYAKTNPDYLYGGYYADTDFTKPSGDVLTFKGYGGVTAENIETAKAEARRNGTAAVTDAVIYNGARFIPNSTTSFWYKMAAQKKNGETDSTPEVRKVYYLKEVPSGYLSTRVLYAKDENQPNSNGDPSLIYMYLLSVVDDSYYDGVRFKVFEGDHSIADARAIDYDDAIASTISASFKLAQKGADGKELPGAITVNYESFGLKGGYIASASDHDLVSNLSEEEPKKFTVLPVWKTLDGIIVDNVAVGYTITNKTTVTATPLYEGYIGTEILYVNMQLEDFGGTWWLDGVNNGSTVLWAKVYREGTQEYFWTTFTRLSDDSDICSINVPKGKWNRIQILRTNSDFDGSDFGLHDFGSDKDENNIYNFTSPCTISNEHNYLTMKWNSDDGREYNVTGTMSDYSN